MRFVVRPKRIDAGFEEAEHGLFPDRSRGGRPPSRRSPRRLFVMSEASGGAPQGVELRGPAGACAVQTCEFALRGRSTRERGHRPRRIAHGGERAETEGHIGDDKLNSLHPLLLASTPPRKVRERHSSTDGGVHNRIRRPAPQKSRAERFSPRRCCAKATVLPSYAARLARNGDDASLRADKKGAAEAALSIPRLDRRLDQKSMPPMPPPPAAHRHRGLLLRQFGDHRLGGDQQTGDRGRVLQRGAHDLRRVDDAGLDHVDILLGLGVEAVGLRLVLDDLADHDRAFDARVLDDLADRRLERLRARC